MLIWLQDPEAEYVASKTTYNKMGYHVNKNDNAGIKIYMPQFYDIVKIISKDGSISYKPSFSLSADEKKLYKDKNNNQIQFYKKKLSGFNVGNVFNVKDTNMPKSVIENEINPTLQDPAADGVTNVLIKAIYKDGFKVKYDDLIDGRKGYCDYNSNTIVIRKGLSNLMQLKVLIHEYAHALAHKHLNQNKLDYQQHRNKYETEAEAISYVVSKYLNIETENYSLNYLCSCSENKVFKEIDDSFNTIVNYSKIIIQNFEKFYSEEFGLYAEEYKKI